MARVDYQNVCRSFGSFDALIDFDLTVDEGEFVVMVGPSGSGKTTALRILAGLDTPTSGVVRLNGEPVNDVPPSERDIAMVFQSYALYPHMTVRQNLSYGLKRRKLDGAEIDRRIVEAARLLELDGLLDRRPRQLSGGQQQRVAVCRALVRQPGVLLMDEPLSNLDARLRAHARGEIKSLQREVGATTVYVTHDQIEAMTMGTRVAVMNEGRVAQFDTPKEVYARPADRFVAGFMGSPAMSFIDVELSRTAGGSRMLVAGVAAHLPDESERAPTGAITVGIRPEHIHLWEHTLLTATAVGPFAARVELVEHLGRESFVDVRLESGELLTSQIPLAASVRVGETVRIGFDRDALHFFDHTTGRSVARSSDWSDNPDSVYR